jgi:uncharacterized phiE125 gp8 family phage protein
MEVKVKTDVVTEPLTEATAKNYLKYSGTNVTEIALIASMVRAAREICEQYTGLTFAKKTLQVYFEKDDFSDNVVILPFNPIDKTSVVVKRVDSEGIETTITKNSDYYLRGNQSVDLQIASFISTVGVVNSEVDYLVEYDCGYGISGKTESLPSGLMLAMEKLLSEWYENREDWMPVLSSSVKKILDQFSVNLYI